MYIPLKFKSVFTNHNGWYISENIRSINVLGVEFNSKLQWSKHVAKAKFYIGHFMSPELKKVFFKQGAIFALKYGTY